MNQKKLKTIKKYQDITVTGKLPIALDNLDQAKFLLHEAKTTNDTKKLIVPTIYMVEAKESLKLAKKQLNDAIKKQQLKAKSIDLALVDLEKEIKTTVLSVVEISKKPAKDRSGNYKTDENGELIYNDSHNLNTTMFKYLPKATSHVVDKAELLKIVLADKENPLYANLLNEEITHTLNDEVLNEIIFAGKMKLPMTTLTRAESIAINGTKILKETKELLKLTVEEEEEE